jgi:hypothetical protein
MGRNSSKPRPEQKEASRREPQRLMVWYPPYLGHMGRTSSQPQDVKKTTTEDDLRSRLYGIRCTWATWEAIQVQREMRKRRLQKIAPEADCMVYAALGPHGPKFKPKPNQKRSLQKIAPEADCMVYVVLGPHGREVKYAKEKAPEDSPRGRLHGIRCTWAARAEIPVNHKM